VEGQIPVDTPEIPAWDSKQGNQQEAEQEWIAKYRRALELVPPVRRARRSRIHDTVMLICRSMVPTFRRLWDRWFRPGQSESTAAAKRAPASAQTSVLKGGASITGRGQADLTRSVG